MSTLKNEELIDSFEFVSQIGNAQQWRSASQAIEMVWS
jgi:hypothetical protein